MKIKSNGKNSYKPTKHLIYIFSIIVAVLMIPSCSVKNKDNDSNLTNNGEIVASTTALSISETESTESIELTTTTKAEINETQGSLDSIYNEDGLDFGETETISYQEFDYRNWTVEARKDKPNSLYFYFDYIDDTTPSQNIQLAEYDISLIKSIDDLESFSVFLRDKNGIILGSYSSIKMKDNTWFNPINFIWSNSEYEEAYSILHPDEEEQSQATSNEDPTTSTTEITTSSATTEAEKSTVTIGQKNALDSAKSYLRFMAFSYEGIIKQLEYEGFSNSEAVYAADNCGADWNKQALKSAKSYLDVMSFSYDGLIEQLEYDGFTHEQAVYGADNCGMNSKDQVLESALLYLKTSAFSYSGLIEQLESEGFSHEDAVSAADRCGADWNEQAAKSAKAYLQFMDFTKSELIDQLQYEGFTYEQAAYGAEANGL